MKASNLGVVFGPTLMRPERESVASIVDIKYQNIIIEMMISEREKVNVCWRGLTNKTCLNLGCLQPEMSVPWGERKK